MGTHFDYNNRIAFISTYTKIGTPHKKGIHCRANGSEFAGLAFSNVVANLRQCLSPIESKLSPQDTNQTLGKASW